VQAGTYSPPSKETLQRYLLPWLEGRTHLRPTTRETYAILIERYICNEGYGIGTAPLWTLTRPGIRHFYAELERRGRMRGDRPLTAKAVHNVHLVLRRALEDAVEDGLIPANPARRAHKLAVRRPEMKTWTEGQVASFLVHVRDHRLYGLWRTAATTGMRRGELLAVTWPALDLAAGRLHVTQALAKGPRGEAPRLGPPKTDRGRRAVPLDPETVNVLVDHRRRQLDEGVAMAQTYQDHGLVFCRQDGRPLDPDWVTHTFERLARQAGPAGHPVPRPAPHLRHAQPQGGDPDRGRQPDPGAPESGHHAGLLPARCSMLGGGRDRAVRRPRGRSQERLARRCGYQTGIRARARARAAVPSPSSTCGFARRGARI